MTLGIASIHRVVQGVIVTGVLQNGPAAQAGTITLDEISSVASCGDFRGADRGTGRQHFPFDVVTEERTYHLHAESEEERRGWMDALAHNLALRRRRQGKA